MTEIFSYWEIITATYGAPFFLRTFAVTVPSALIAFTLDLLISSLTSASLPTQAFPDLTT